VDPSEHPLREAIDRLRERDPRFRREAYLFVVGALGHAVQQLPPERMKHPERRHLSGREVLSAVVELGRREFGPLAPTVFREWGLTDGRHVGEIVFQLVACGQLSAREEDTIEDFLGVPDLPRALGDSAAPAPAPGDPH